MMMIVCILLFNAFLGGRSIILNSQDVEVRSKERLRLVQADSLGSTSVDGSNIRELWVWGRVKFVQGEAHISCDEAHLREKEDKALLLGNVTIYDGKRTLKADRVDYDGRTRTEIATGNVSLESGKRKLECLRLTYSQEKEIVSGANNSDNKKIALKDFQDLHPGLNLSKKSN